MNGEMHNDGPVVFKALPSGRETACLGNLQVGEIMPLDGHLRHGACFRLLLPDTSVAAWRPVLDIETARRQLSSHLIDWLNAADLRPNGAP